MRLTTIRIDGATTAGRVDGDEIAILPFADAGALLASGADWAAVVGAATGETIPLSEADYAPLLSRPEKVICVGVNYRSHIEEVRIPAPDHPTIFAKFSRSLIGPYDDIVLPANSDAVDWEVELGAVIGAPVRNATTEQAWEAIAGYTIVNDVTMRDWQLRTSQFLQGKTFEASTPVGPFLVTPDEIDHARDLRMTCKVDDAIMQDERTSAMLYSVADLVAYISSIITLMPGDLIATGTPAGIGAARRPPVFLTPGRTLVSRIDGLGEQANRCLAPTLVEVA